MFFELAVLVGSLVYPAGAAVANKIANDAGPAGQQPGYTPAPGYPHVQYAQDNYQPQAQYGYPQHPVANRFQERHDCAYAYADPRTGAFYAEVTLPSTLHGAFTTTMQHDPGASCVVLSHTDFTAMGFDVRRQRFTIECDAVSSVERAAPVLLPMMGVGQIRLNQVKALVTQSDCGVSLLGQTALQQFSQIVQRGPEIIFQR